MYLAKGTYGFVFGGEGGPLPCIGEETPDKTIITKLLTDIDAMEEYAHTNILNEIDPEQTFLLYPLGEPCRPKPFEELSDKYKGWLIASFFKGLAPTKPPKSYSLVNEELIGKYNNDYMLVKYKYGGKDVNKFTSDVPLIKFLSAFRLLMEGVKKMHKKGVYHCDIKPDNIVINTDNDDMPIIRLIDFGLMHAFDGRTRKWNRNDDILDSDYAYWPFFNHYLFYTKSTTERVMINQLTKYNNEELRKIQQYIPFEVFTIKDGEKPRVKLTVKTLSPEQKEKGYISITDQFEYTKSLGENELKMRVLRRTDMYGLGISLSTALDDKYARNRHIRKFEGLIARLMSQDLTDDDITLDECIDRYDAIVDSLSGRANVREPITT
jgi:serine/threonine protein kinase